MALTRIFALGICHFTICFNCLSEGPKNDTLHDGTPFRKDAQGVEIIDYVAELEHSVTYLKDRVRELEQQVETANHTIDRLKDEATQAAPRAIAEPKLFEADLDIAPDAVKKTNVKPAIVKEVPASPSKESSPKVVKAKLPEIKLPEISATPAAKETREVTTTKKEPIVVAAVNKPAEKVPAIKKEESNNLSTANKKVDVVKAKPIEVAPTIVRPAPKRLDPVEIARVEVRKDVNTVRLLRVERDKAFKAYLDNQTKSTALKINPAKAISKRGNSIERLESAINLASRERDLYQVRTELSQIKRVLSDDISLITRISKTK